MAVEGLESWCVCGIERMKVGLVLATSCSEMAYIWLIEVGKIKMTILKRFRSLPSLETMLLGFLSCRKIFEFIGVDYNIRISFSCKPYN